MYDKFRVRRGNRTISIFIDISKTSGSRAAPCTCVNKIIFVHMNSKDSVDKMGLAFVRVSCVLSVIKLNYLNIIYIL